MRHHVFSAAIGLVLAAALLPASATSASAADPTGYWRKANQGQFPAKMQLYYCGGRSICVKIVWLQNPRDSKGRVLQDVRNATPSLRGRTIEGMHIIRGMKQVSANQWKGTVYNPEDGKTYSASVTLASSRKIVLKGCVAAFLCREQVWLRTSAPPPKEEEKKPEPQVEASAKPEATKTDGASSADAATSGSSVANAEVLAPADQQNLQPGYRYLNASKTNQHPEGFNGESVSSMFSMATPVAPSSAPAATSAAPAPAQSATKETPAPVQQQAAVPPEPAPAPRETETAVPEPEPSSTAEDEQSMEPTESQTAESEAGPDERLSWRERRQLRRQRRLKELQAQGQNLIPWLR